MRSAQPSWQQLWAAFNIASSYARLYTCKYNVV
jgi:hypothetical protein